MHAHAYTVLSNPSTMAAFHTQVLLINWGCYPTCPSCWTICQSAQSPLLARHRCCHTAKVHRSRRRRGSTHLYSLRGQHQLPHSALSQLAEASKGPYLPAGLCRFPWHRNDQPHLQIIPLHP